MAALESILCDSVAPIVIEESWDLISSIWPHGLALGMTADAAFEHDTSSHRRTKKRFGSAKAAAKYDSRQMLHRRRCEVRCILSALEGIPNGSEVLDLPCGTGFLTPILAERGYQVTCADYSPHMIERAERTWQSACQAMPKLRGRSEFAIQDIFDTSFCDGQFAAVICNRLFHHFVEPKTRQAALAELRRISSGPIIVFFFNSFALDTIRYRVSRALFGRFKRDRIPIALREFVADGAAVGLRLERVLATRWGISPQCYAVFRAEQEVC